MLHLHGWKYCRPNGLQCRLHSLFKGTFLRDCVSLLVSVNMRGGGRSSGSFVWSGWLTHSTMEDLYFVKRGYPPLRWRCIQQYDLLMHVLWLDYQILWWRKPDTNFFVQTHCNLKMFERLLSPLTFPPSLKTKKGIGEPESQRSTEDLSENHSGPHLIPL